MPDLTIDWTGARERPQNWTQYCDNVADSYPRGVAHGVQKDAIQNSADAVGGSKPLVFTCELVNSNGGRFVTLSDANTVGLTGRVFEREEYTEELPDEERWARFESMGFTRHDPDARGARGQGKLIFMAASKKKMIFYDSLRADGSYRLGFTEARVNSCPVKHRDGNDGRVMLRENTGLEPLSRIGTRIIIVDPVDELVEALRNGEFLAAVEETWFRLIERERAAIRVVVDGNEREASVPRPFPVSARDGQDFKVWRPAENQTIRIAGQPYRIKRFAAAYDVGGAVPEGLRGVAVVHLGMKICSLQMDAAQAVRERVFGFIEFDKALDRELRKTENQRPNHYELDWRRRVPQAIKAYVEDQLRQFGEQKLGLATDPRARRQRIHADAERWALQQLSRFVGELDILQGRGTVRPTGGNGDDKTLGLAIRGLRFPVPDRAPRVNWGEQIGGFSVEAFNRTEETRSVAVSAFVLQGNRQVVVCQPRVLVDLTPGSRKVYGPLAIDFSNGVFPEPGRYVLRALMVDTTDGSRLDEISRHIWVERDPPFRSPFDMQAANLEVQQQWRMRVDPDGQATLLYNVGHHAYRYAEVDDRELGLYMFNLCLEGAMHLILRRPIEGGHPDYHPLDTANVEGGGLQCYMEVISKMSELRERVYSGLT